MIESGSVTLQDFFNKFSLKISDYQRPYVWSEHQFLKLYDDLCTYQDNSTNKPLYYIGTVILVKIKTRDIYEIIDGQQRLISLLLIKILAKDVINDNNKDFRVGSDITKNNIKRNVAYLKAKRNVEKIDFSKINITYIITEDQDQAFKFYTTLNTSGKKLNGIDIIKPFHLQALNKDQQDQQAKELEKYQFQDNYLEIVSKCLLRIRYWNHINFKEFPRNENTNLWKEILSNEFAHIYMKQDKDLKYGYAYQEVENTLIHNINYQARQPLSKGRNTINYLLMHCHIWEKMHNQLNAVIFEKLDRLRGIEFNSEYFEMCLLAYLSRFGISKIDDLKFESNAKLLFKVCFDARLNKPVQKNTIRDFEKKHSLLNRILYEFDEESIFFFCKQFKCQVCPEYDSGVIKNFREKFCYNESNLEQPFFENSKL